MNFNAEPEWKPLDLERKVFTSAAERFADKFQKWIEKKSLLKESFTDEAQLTDAVQKSRILVGTTLAPVDIVVELKKLGFLAPALPEKKKHAAQPEEFFTGFQKYTVIEDDAVRQLWEQNAYIAGIKKDVFKDEKDLNAVYDRALRLENKDMPDMEKSYEYYLSFAYEGLILGGEKEARKDFDDLQQTKRKIREQREALSPEAAHREENLNKVATITERGIAYCISSLEWYGKNIHMTPSSNFDDIKRGVDDMIEIEKNESERSFIGLGIDVTYSGLLGEEYKDKFFKLLTNIRDGYAANVKYFTNHKGEMMKEFSVPKIILSFNKDDVQRIVYMIKNIDDAQVQERIKGSSMKFSVMNQVIVGCELLGAFAEESQNPIAEKYKETVSIIQSLASENPKLQQIIDARYEDGVSRRMKQLIEEFKALERLEEESK